MTGNSNQQPSLSTRGLTIRFGGHVAVNGVTADFYPGTLTVIVGPGRREVLFRQEGRRVIGFIESDSASGRFVGSIDGPDLEFTAVLEFGGEPMAAVYRAKVDGDRMEGTIDFGL